MKSIKTHGMVQMPDGKTVGDMLPQYADVKAEYGPIGTPCKVGGGIRFSQQQGQ